MIYFWFKDNKGDFIFIALLLVILGTILICGYMQKRLEKKQDEHLNSHDEDYKAQE